MYFPNIKTYWTEHKGFDMERKDIGEDYIFLYYHTPITVWLQGGPVEAPAGSLLIYRKHSYQRQASPLCELSHDWFHVRGDLETPMKAAKLEFNTLYHLPEATYITEAISRMEVEHIMHREHYEEISSYILYELLLRIGRDVHSSTAPESGDGVIYRMVQARQKIHAAYYKDWTVDQMAELIPISVAQFYNLYKKIFRITPKRDLQTVRISHAKDILATHQYTVKRVAEITGFANAYHFNNAFKAYTGMTPGQYVKKVRRGER